MDQFRDEGNLIVLLDRVLHAFKNPLKRFGRPQRKHIFLSFHNLVVDFYLQKMIIHFYIEHFSMVLLLFFKNGVYLIENGRFVEF